MSTRRNIQGPHSALTDFLASHNISAAEIRDSYQQRLRDARRQEQQNGESGAQELTAEAGADEEDQDDEPAEAPVTRRTPGRKRKNTATAEKAKAAKKKKKNEKRADSGDEDDDLDASDDGFWVPKKRSLPGQLANCEICNKRFTVTPYSKTGPEGGLLCAPCSKELVAEEKKGKASAKKQSRKGRRQNFSNILDGIAQKGAFSLLEMCIKRVADNIHDVEEFGDLPQELLHRLSQILSKRRVLTPRTLELFLRRDVNSIEIFDCAKLEEEDFQKIFAFMPYLRKVDFRCAGQMKDSTLEYIASRECHISHLHLDACNLLTDQGLRNFFEACGSKLEVLKLSNLDCSMDDETVAHMVKHCPNLRSLRLKECWRPGDESLESIAKLDKLEHLSLHFLRETNQEYILNLIENVGPKLQTLSLRGFTDADNEVLDTIHWRCTNLHKLRLSGNSTYTDEGFAELFTNWANPGLTFVDVSSTRDMDNTNPEGPEEAIGLASEGFKALMAHSGSTLQVLNINSCRHISFDAFSEVFDAEQHAYPQLKELDISFHTRVDDFLVGRVFKCCPALSKVIAFACFQVRDVAVPPGVALLGGVNAHRAIGHEEGGLSTDHYWARTEGIKA